MAEVKAQMQSKHDWFRRFVMREPRGHNDMFGAVLFPPKRKGCDLGVVFMDNGGYLDMCGHGIIGVVTCAVQTSIIKPKPEILVETPAGIVKTRIHYGRNKVQSVSFVNVPAFKVKTTEVTIAGRPIPVDIAFGGNMFAHVYARDIGINIEPENKNEIIDLGMRIRDAINSREKIVHPEQPGINNVQEVQFSGPPKSEGVHAQNAVVFGQGQMDRSPCGTGTCAKMALLHSEGKLRIDDWFVHESIIRTRIKGRLLAETKVAKYDAVIPEIVGSAYITGFNRLVHDRNDPLVFGFLL